MRVLSVPRLAAVLAGPLIILATATPALAVGTPSTSLAGYAAGPSASSPPYTDHVQFVVPTLTCPGVTAVSSSLLAGDAITDYPVSGASGAIWGGVVLACTPVPPPTPTSPPSWTASYTAEGFDWTPTYGLQSSTLFTVAPGQTVAVTTDLNSVAVDDFTSGQSATATLPTVGAGQADIGIFCPASTWYPTLPPCPASPKLTKVKFSKATVNAGTLGSYAPAASYITGPGFTIKPSALNKAGNGFKDTYR